MMEAKILTHYLLYNQITGCSLVFYSLNLQKGFLM